MPCVACVAELIDVVSRASGVFALACAAGILALFIRRFFVRPRWLGAKLSYQSGFIAFLIFVLMVTYLASFYLQNADPATRALWWVHTLALLTFLPIIPHTKHLHLVLSPLTVPPYWFGWLSVPVSSAITVLLVLPSLVSVLTPIAKPGLKIDICL